MSVEISRFSQQFSFMGLSETNVGSDAGSVYMIPGYKPFYQDTYNNKKKWTFKSNTFQPHYREPELQHGLCELSLCKACHSVRPILYTLWP